MCFSPEASFTSAAILVPMGIYCICTAYRRLPRFWGYAVIPLVFGIQQAAEGAVWLGLTRDRPDLFLLAARIYLFFALAWWPVWFAVAGALAVQSRPLRDLLALWALFSTGWFFFVYLPALASLPEYPPTLLHHSIRYVYSDDLVFGGAGGWASIVLYYLGSGVPLLLAGPFLGVQRRMFLVPVLFGLATVLISLLVYAHAFTSVWCFFAALLSAYCTYFFATAPGDLPVR